MSKNESLGSIACDGCDGQADICQTKRGAGRFLYTRCAECGTDQRTGAAVQSRLWHNATWFNGEPEVRPPNIQEKQGLKPEPEPVSEPGQEPGEPEKEPGKRGVFWPLAALAVVAAVATGRGL